MSRTDVCDVCGRTVTITTSRGEYVTGLQGYEYHDGSIRCHANEHASEGKCAKMENGEVVEIEA